MISKSLGSIVIGAALVFGAATPTFADNADNTSTTKPAHKHHRHPRLKKALHAHKKKSTTQPANQ